MELRKCLYNTGGVRPAFWVWVLVSLGTCKKESTEQPGPGSNNEAKLVRSIEFDNGATKTMYYNKDSTLKEITYRYGNVVSSTIFNWEDRRLKCLKRSCRSKMFFIITVWV